MLQGPNRLARSQPPGWQSREKGRDFLEILGKIRPEIELGSGLHSAGHGLQKLRSHDPVFMMPLFGPRIREEHPNLLKRDARRQGLEKFPGLGAEKVTIRQFGPTGFFLPPQDTVAANIDPEAGFIRKLRRITGQKVAVAAADFPNNTAAVGGKPLGQFLREGCPALGDALQEFGFESHEPIGPTD